MVGIKNRPRRFLFLLSKSISPLFITTMFLELTNFPKPSLEKISDPINCDFLRKNDVMIPLL